jgi:protein gp37
MNNRSNIEWTYNTNNSITGCLGPKNKDGVCERCPYCYADKTANNERMKNAFPEKFNMRWIPKRLTELKKQKTPSLFFMDSMSDMFGYGCEECWVKEVFKAMAENPQHIYQILTKCPERIKSMVTKEMYRPNIWIGSSIDSVDALKRIKIIQNVPKFKGFLSFEPLLERMPKHINFEWIDWVIIGQQTKPFNNPPEEWVYELVDQVQKWGIPIFIKNNLLERGYTGRGNLQQFPKEMMEIVNKYPKYPKKE